MLNGHFENCYGIKAFDMGKGIDFNNCNKAFIYAPNGVMKSSFSKIFEDISEGKPSEDRIFKDRTTSYSVTYETSTYQYTSLKPKDVPNTDAIYVVNSYMDKFEFTKETVSTLLADEATRNKYNVIMSRLSDEIKAIEEALRLKAGISKPQIKLSLISDLNLASTSDWPDIMNSIEEVLTGGSIPNYLNEIKYAVLFNDKAIAVYKKPEFQKNIAEYIKRLDDLLSNSIVLNTVFTDRSAENLGKELAKDNLFDASHTIVLCDGTVIKSIDEWNEVINEQLKKMYSDDKLSKAFEKLKKILTANNDVSNARDAIIAHPEVIPLLLDIGQAKKFMWGSYFDNLDKDFTEYKKVIDGYAVEIKALYEQAATQSKRWKQVVDEFNRRFRVPYKVKVDNKSNFILKDEAPSLSFDYQQKVSETDNASCNLTKDDLMKSLSTGEKHALYLLYILFDLERIRIQANEGGRRFLIITDDISDSFDYKNKYAIIEYLADLSKNPGMDLLMLTHNFDFYRTAKSRLNVSRPNCYIAQRNTDGAIDMSEFRYQKDFFKKVIVEGIQQNKDSDKRKKMLIASIPFYRNLSEYSGSDQDYLDLTCFMHYKTTPISTDETTLDSLWSIVKKYIGEEEINFDGENYFECLKSIDSKVLADSDDVSLENKLVLSIGVRLLAERYLKKVITDHTGSCDDAKSNQMREWYNQAKAYLNDVESAFMDEVNLITPETIHLNTFMYEPLIDVSIWNLKDLYKRAMLL